jgi:hypothetical protein
VIHRDFWVIVNRLVSLCRTYFHAARNRFAGG